LNVQGDANAAAAIDGTAGDEREAAALLPAGFAMDAAQGEAIAVTGSTNATSLNRGMMNERLQAIEAGQLDPATGQLAEGCGPRGPGGFGPGGPNGFDGRGGPGGGRGGPGFFLGGRGARGQNAYSGSTSYTFGGSALDTPPYQVNPNVPATQPQFAQ